MTPEPICIELADGTSFSAMAQLKDGYLQLDMGGFIGTVKVRPNSAIPVCRRILEILGAKGPRLPTP